MNKTINILTFIVLLSSSVNAQNIKEIAKKGINSTVSIVALDKYRQPLGYGSGFIVDNETVVTNVHVLEGAKSAYILLNDNNKFKVDGIIAIDKPNDLAILKVTGLNEMPLKLGADILPEIGEKVFAVGNPKGLNGTFSEGIVSGKRDIENNDVIQITAPISPGSSGGPVLNNNSDVIGIAFASYSAGQNLNFAIPVKYLRVLLTKKGNIISFPLAKLKTVNKPKTNIKEGVTIRNIKPCYDDWCSPSVVFFSIKNNLPYSVSDISLLVMVYDSSGVIIDYAEETYFKENGYRSKPIKPFLAKSIDTHSDGAPEVSLKRGYKVKIRVLDFNIIEE
tara:strand:+ start:84 stop:1088 length:1005 start_codon:yes stop_codon:yes gene_type:complete